MTSVKLDEKALEAAKTWFSENFNGLPDTQALTLGIITAYLSAIIPSQAGSEAVAEERTLSEACRILMTKIYNRGHSGLDLDCRLCQTYIAADRLLSFETGAPLSDEVLSWDRRNSPTIPQDVPLHPRRER